MESGIAGINNFIMDFNSLYGLLYESYVDKQVNKTAHYIEANHPRLIGLERTQAGNPKTAKDLANDVKNQMPILVSSENGAKAGKFILGAARIFYYEIEKNRRDVSAQLSRYIKTLIDDGHSDQFDENLNGLSYQQLEDTFKEATQRASDNEREEFAKAQWSGQSDYEVVRIDSTEEAAPYAKYLNPEMPWCITQDQQYYDSYTNGGIGVFYFVLKKGYQSIPCEKGPNHPHDEYGESMMAVAVDQNGNLLNCTSRWNGRGDFMNARELSQRVGRNFYDVFKPRTFEEVVYHLGANPYPDFEDNIAKRHGFQMVASGGRYYWDTVAKIDYENKKITMGYYNNGLGERILWTESGEIITEKPVEVLDPSYLPIPMMNANVRVEKVIVPDTVTEIAPNTFRGSIWIKEVIIPDTVRKIGKNAFTGTSLESIEIPDSVIEIGEEAFSKCRSLSQVKLSESLTEIKSETFCNTNISSIEIPETVKSIGENVFSQCRHLISIEIPNTVTDIGDCAFGNCDNMKSIKLPDTITEIPIGMCISCLELESVIIPDTVKTIHQHAFANCYKLASLKIGKSVTTIGPSAFCNSSIETVVIPPNVRFIDYGAFLSGASDEVMPKTAIIQSDDVYIDNRAFEPETKIVRSAPSNPLNPTDPQPESGIGESTILYHNLKWKPQDGDPLVLLGVTGLSEFNG